MDHFDRLERRTHFAAGLDASFGKNGQVALSGGLASAVTAGPGVFVVTSTLANGRYTSTLAKYTAAGQPDTKFGSGGRISLALPATLAGDTTVPPRVTLAFDPSSGYVYVGQVTSRVLPARAGVRVEGTQQTLVVRRYYRAGGLDTDFGDGGTFAYGAAAYTGTGRHDDLITVGRLVPLSDRRLLVAVERETVQGNADPTNSVNVHDQDVALIRLNTRGTRDSAFGRGGIVSVNRATGRSTSGDLYSSFSGTTLRFGDVDVNRAGNYRVVDTGTRSTQTTIDTGPDGASISVHSVSFADATTIDGAGRQITGAGFRATVTRQDVDNGDYARVGQFRPLLAVSDGGGVLLAGSATPPDNARTSNITPRDLKVIRLTPTSRSVSDLALPRSARFNGVARGGDGATYFVTNKGATRFNSHLTLYKAFAAGGTSPIPFFGVYAVDSGGRLLFADSTLGRLVG